MPIMGNERLERLIDQLRKEARLRYGYARESVRRAREYRKVAASLIQDAKEQYEEATRLDAKIASLTHERTESCMDHSL